MAKKKQNKRGADYLIIQNMDEGTIFAGEVNGSIHCWPKKIGKKRFIKNLDTNYNLILIQDRGWYLRIIGLSTTPRKYAEMGFIDKTVEEAYEGCGFYSRAIPTAERITISIGDGDEKTKGLLKKIFSEKD